MYARIVTFRLAGLTADEYRATASSVAPAFAEWSGLLAKVWIADDVAGTYGGIYLFTDRASADASRETDVFRALSENPAFVDVAVREFDVLDAPTTITGGPLVTATTS